MSKRFIIESDGIHDKCRGNKCLDLWELYNTLNALDNIASKNLDEYEYIMGLEKEINELKRRLDDKNTLLFDALRVNQNLSKRIRELESNE